jgi:hypothetical protein
MCMCLSAGVVQCARSEHGTGCDAAPRRLRHTSRLRRCERCKAASALTCRQQQRLDWLRPPAASARLWRQVCRHLQRDTCEVCVGWTRHPGAVLQVMMASAQGPLAAQPTAAGHRACCDACLDSAPTRTQQCALLAERKQPAPAVKRGVLLAGSSGTTCSAIAAASAACCCACCCSCCACCWHRQRQLHPHRHVRQPIQRLWVGLAGCGACVEPPRAEQPLNTHAQQRPTHARGSVHTHAPARAPG